MSEKKGDRPDEVEDTGGATDDDNELEVAGPEVVDEGSTDDPVLGQRRGASDLAAIAEIPVQLSAVLGKASMPVNQLLRLGRGAVVELDRRVGEPIDILVNSRLVARGEVVVVDDRLGVTMTEIIKSDH